MRSVAGDLAAVVMAAGLGTRMRSAVPKHLHPLLGRRLVDWTIAAAASVEPARLVVVCSPESAGAFDGVAVAVQEQPLGTGDAVRSARGQVGDASEVLVLSGDTPLLTDELMRDLLDAHRREGAVATVLSFTPADPRAYGRIVRGADGHLVAIVEAADASPEQLAIGEVNSSMYVFAAGELWPALDRLEPANAQGELYLTDVVRLLVDGGKDVAVHEASDASLVEGVNTRAELAAAAALLRDRINEAHMLAGVTIVDPHSTWIDADVEIEPDVTIHPFTVIRGAVRIASGVEIGPFAYLRPGTAVAERAKIGTFVEIKNSQVGAGAKVPHLSYIGDAEIGEGTNVAAGNVTANYSHIPGEPKKRTRIGSNVRTGVDNTFLAPVDVGDDAWLAPGTVISEDVPPGSLAGFPPRQITKEGWVYDKHGKRDD
jgi:bifunctional UDP-N-acetylglucosamine pyrophosphorylase/glucosamine-1-phosphate N-acetyltransferase